MPLLKKHIYNAVLESVDAVFGYSESLANYPVKQIGQFYTWPTWEGSFSLNYVNEDSFGKKPCLRK